LLLQVNIDFDCFLTLFSFFKRLFNLFLVEKLLPLAEFDFNVKDDKFMRPCEANDNDRFLISAKGTVQDLVDSNTYERKAVVDCNWQSLVWCHLPL